ncbi:unknown protein [Waddlia chondrophila 2032/99]|uniref:Uncharacterized protein n=1 Tax=Waddlia chondrophila 2032/99 TaxID=765953 RepID=F8LBZ1_9BACT|nr:unknown protein [Waddlia chondrophila 2032/99]
MAAAPKGMMKNRLSQIICQTGFPIIKYCLEPLYCAAKIPETFVNVCPPNVKAQAVIPPLTAALKASVE